MAESIKKNIIREAIKALRNHIYRLELYGLSFTLENTAETEYAIMAEINGSPLCVAHINA